MVLLEILLLHRRFKLSILVSVTIILLGVTAVTVQDVQVEGWKGSVYGLLGSLLTSLNYVVSNLTSTSV